MNGYDDWFLPSYKELAAINENKSAIPNMTGIYWSSSEWIYVDAHFGQITAFTASTANFTVPKPLEDNNKIKTNLHKVRAVRKF